MHSNNIWTNEFQRGERRRTNEDNNKKKSVSKRIMTNVKIIILRFEAHHQNFCFAFHFVLTMYACMCVCVFAKKMELIEYKLECE